MSMPNQQDPNPERKVRGGHGMPIPTLDLEKAISLIEKVWDKEKRNAAPVSSVLSHWGYGLKSSGGFQAVASLKRFGLLDEEGSKERRTLKLSPLALDILKNATTDLPEYYRALKRAAMHPKAHQEMWARYGVELPSDPTLQSYLVFDRQFSEDAAKQFIRLYKDTISFAKLASGDTVEETDNDDDSSEESHQENEQTEKPAAGGSTFQSRKADPPPIKPSVPNLNPSVKYFAIPTDIGDAMIPMGMSEEDFTLFEGALKLFKKKIISRSRFPVGAIWRNNDFDKPVTIVAEMGEQNGVKYFQSQDGTGIPESELTFA